jgi:hypothetical protein
MAQSLKLTAPRKRGPKPRAPKSDAAASLAALESETGKRRRQVSGRDRRFIDAYAELGFQSPTIAAATAGFKHPGVGYKLLDRLHDLVEDERLRRQMTKQMELGEALELAAGGARDTSDRKSQLGFVRTILQVHGALNPDQSLPKQSRGQLVKQLEDMVGRIKAKVGAGARVKAALMVGVEDLAPESSEDQAKQ